MVSTVAALLGSIICYYIGYFGGAVLIEKVKKRFPSTEVYLDKLAKWFSKYGKESVLVARLMPVVRTYVSLLAGAEKIKIVPFVIYSTIGILIWNLILILLGYYIGHNLALINTILGRYSDAVIVITVIAVIIYIVKKFKKK